MEAQEQAWKRERVELLTSVEADESKAAAAEACGPRAKARVVVLETLVKKLLAELEESRRRGNGQAAPLRNPSGPKAKPKKPGDNYRRHFRREAPDAVDKTLVAPLPEDCSACGEGGIDPVKQYQIDLPRKPIRSRFLVQVGRCRKWGRRVQGRHPLQTSYADSIHAPAGRATLAWRWAFAS